VDVETVASTMKVVLFWAVGILIPIIGLQAEEVIDDMVILEAPSRQSRQYATPMTPNYPFAVLTGLAFRREAATMNQPCVTREGKMGLCMGVNECHPERKIFQISRKDTWLFGLYNTCAFETNKGKQVFGVCCTKVFPQMDTRDNTIPAENDLAARKCSPAPTNHKCYYDGRRIVNGQEAPKNAYPFMAAMMRVSSYSNNARQFCGGSLIDESHVLTAAHCIEGFSASDVKTLRIYLGAHDIKTGSRSEHRVVRIIKHKDFNPSTLVNDIAILTLETPARMSNSVKTVCLPTVSSTYVNRRVTVSGWGALSEGGGQPSALHEVDVTVMSNAQCGNKYNSRIPGQIVDSMICAADYNKDSCSGDSGGPLHLVQSGFRVQVGIVSWGIGCARADSPGVYTRVTKMMDWIQRIQNCY